MSLIDRVNQAILSGLEGYLRSWLPDGKVEGHEFVARNPRRSDGKHGSFKINLNTCVWRDFALSEKGGNDPVSLYAYIRSLPMGEAARELAQGLAISDHAPAKAKPPSPAPDPWSIVLPVPPDAPELPPLAPMHWAYRDAKGELLGYIERLDRGEGRKDFFPWTLWKDGELIQWRRKNFPDPRPVYGLDVLAAEPKAAVLIVEGEKTADAARQLLPRIVVISWPGGAKAIEKVDWSPLASRAVAIWPDADEAGKEAAERIAALIHGFAKYVKIIQTPVGVEKGWDLADAKGDGWTHERVWDHITKRGEIWNPPKPADGLTNNSVAENSPPASHQNDSGKSASGLAGQDAPANSPTEIADASKEISTAERYAKFLPFPDVGRNGPRATCGNVETLLDHLGVLVRYNVISKQEEILIPNQSFTIDNEANASFSWIYSEAKRVGLPTDGLDGYLTMIADRNQFNPVQKWISSKAWDGRSRLADFFATVTAAGEQSDPGLKRLKETMMRKWLISAVAAALSPRGISAHGVLVFQGEQYLGKTAWFKRLVPSEYRLIADGMMLRPDDRDSVAQAISFWLVELGELDATFRKSDIAHLKSFLTRDKDVLRRPYARKDSEYARRTVFFASVNPRQFLHDSTGNRRFWTIECSEINHRHELDMQQVWAEVHELFKTGESWFLSPEEMSQLNEHNEAFEAKDSIEERIITDLRWSDAPSLWNEMTATDVLRSLGIDRPTHAEKSKASQIIFKMNGSRKRKTNGLTLLMVPQRIYKTGPVDSFF